MTVKSGERAMNERKKVRRQKLRSLVGFVCRFVNCLCGFRRGWMDGKVAQKAAGSSGGAVCVSPLSIPFFFAKDRRLKPLFFIAFACPFFFSFAVPSVIK